MVSFGIFHFSFFCRMAMGPQAQELIKSTTLE